MLLTYNEFVEEVKKAAPAINRATEDDPNLLGYVAEEVADRISLYLRLRPTPDNDYLFDARIVKVAARIVGRIFTQTKVNENGDKDDTQIVSMTDNGQSITYGDKVKNYLASSEDGEVFGGFTKLLQPYRKVHAISRFR